MYHKPTTRYEITPLTMAVLAYRDKNGDQGTHVMEEKGDFYVRETPSKIIDHACLFFGSSLRGRQEGTRNISGITHKAPISIDPYSGMYFFPTASPSSPTCSWIAHTHILDLNEATNQCTEIIFKNEHKIVVDVSYGSMINQLNRTAQFRYLLNERIK